MLLCDYNYNFSHRVGDKMGSAFTEEEKKIIREQLKKAAREYMIQYGIKKTTVDDLVQKVGISKGAFYKFYGSKELLFFEVIEDFHEEFYAVALKVLKERTDLDLKDRVELAIWESIRYIQEAPIMFHVKDEMPYLLRKVPEEILTEHEEANHQYVEEIIKAFGIKIAVPEKFIKAFMNVLEILFIHQSSIGEKYFHEILKLFIKAFVNKVLE